MDIAKYLSHTEISASRDRTTFSNWVDGKITTDQAINEFKMNNDVDFNVKISQAEFEMWLYSLGYGR